MVHDPIELVLAVVVAVLIAIAWAMWLLPSVKRQAVAMGAIIALAFLYVALS